MTCDPKPAPLTVRSLELCRIALAAAGMAGPGSRRASLALRRDRTPLPRHCLRWPGTLPTWLLTQGFSVRRAHATGLVLALTALSGGPR